MSDGTGQRRAVAPEMVEHFRGFLFLRYPSGLRLKQQGVLPGEIQGQMADRLLSKIINVKQSLSY